MGLSSEDRKEEFTEEELEAYFEAAEHEEPYIPFWQSQKLKRYLAVIVVVMLSASALAYVPQVFSLAAIRFLTTSAQLSQDEHVQVYKQAVVTVNADDRKGTGFLVSEAGWIVTNEHVVGDVAQCEIIFQDGGSYRAKVMITDANTDLAILSMGATDREVLPLMQTTSNFIGESVYIIGNPLVFNGIANEGEIWRLLDGQKSGVMAVKAPIYRGNSGSPVIRKRDGVVVGVIYATTSILDNGANQRVGLAVPSSEVHELMSKLK
jgi:serine protease Do